MTATLEAVNVTLCECGCGEPAPIAKRTDRRVGHVQGRRVRFINGHYARQSHVRTALAVQQHELDRRGVRSPNWRGGRTRIQRGYIRVYAPESPMADAAGHVLEHRLVMAARIGRPLTSDEEVHHVNEDTADNRPENLWLFPDTGSHRHWHETVASGELTLPMPAVALARS